MNANLLQDYQRHISVLKESLAAKEEHYNMLQTDVSPLNGFKNCIRNASATLALVSRHRNTPHGHKFSTKRQYKS